MGKRFSEIGVDPFWPKIASSPRQAPAQHFHLFHVTGAAADPLNVGSGKFDERHGATPARCYARSGGGASGPQNRYILPNGQLAQLVSCPLWPALQITVWVSAQILRAALLAFLAVAFLAHRMELVLGLLVAGQFVAALTEALRPRRG